MALVPRQHVNESHAMLKKLWDDDCGATLTTELVLLSTLTAGGILTMADDIRTGFRKKTQQLVAAISTAGDNFSQDQIAGWQSERFQCVVVADPIDETEQPEPEM